MANATALGIDLYGPIPDDAQCIESGDNRLGYWFTEPGTSANVWVRAQADLDAYEDVLIEVDKNSSALRRPVVRPVIQLRK